MIRRFRLLAGPNGSGKSTLRRRLEHDYAVNFYDFLNADDIYAEVARTGAYLPRIPVTNEGLVAFAAGSSYDETVKEVFQRGEISVADDCIRFAGSGAVNSYTVALVTGFLAAEHLRQQVSFSQETVFSHPSKVEELAQAKAQGFRTYLYFVATEVPEVNLGRVENRAKLGGHSVPSEKVVARHARSLAQVAAAIPQLSRAYFFDNSGEEMRYLAEWGEDEGLKCAKSCEPMPRWFEGLLPALGEVRGELSEGAQFAVSAAEASREAVAEAFAAGLPITVLRDGRVVKLAKETAT